MHTYTFIPVTIVSQYTDIPDKVTGIRSADIKAIEQKSLEHPDEGCFIHFYKRDRIEVRQTFDLMMEMVTTPMEAIATPSENSSDAPESTNIEDTDLP